jgi:diguanylate cyclase (GGDEF)-like protein
VTEPAPDAPARPRIHLVDDSDVGQRRVTELLAAQGWDVEAAPSGEEAFARIAAGAFTVIVTDVTMGAVSGVHLCRLVRADARLRKTPVVLLTGADDPRARFWGRHAGADAHVTKERIFEDLVPMVDDLLRRAAHSPVLAPTGTRAVDPLARLSAVLDRALFESVVASEARRLMGYLHDRSAFLAEVVAIAREVVDYGSLCIDLQGPEGPTRVLDVRDEKTGAALDAATFRDERSTDRSGSMVIYAIEADEPLGTMVATASERRIGAEDEATLALLAREIAVPAKALFLVERVRALASTDALTGLWNRRRMTERIAEELARFERHGAPLSVAIVDADKFKNVNDVFGHAAGDEVLRYVASTLRTGVRTIDAVARWGGEEFLVVLSGAGADGARIVCERLRARIASKKPCDPGPDTVTASFGLAEAQRGDTAETMVARADTALYRAKGRGRNRVEIG